MDLDPQPTVDDARPAATVEEPTSGPITGLARSYECTFCKRGFSNAQALGGHMNIHRKDRAKLKQTTSPAHFPFDISQRTTTSYMPVLAPNTPRAGSKGPRQLPLLVEAPTTGRDERELGDNDHGPVELDLELRLGLQRPDSSAAAIDLKEFV